ncbi:glycosyltransferase [Ectothiorhodospiraceae bacterium 2226]|nr:glycosyltransferase [Ectothiorhodospiraceae bacterium 2226]
MSGALNWVILGLSITSSWGNGHATTYRGLVRELCAQGHRVLFLERDMPWYAAQRDLPAPPYGQTRLYDSLEELKDRYADAVRDADVVVVGSYVPDGIEVGRWAQREARGLVAFYDIDTPVTLAALKRGACEYLSPALIPGYGIYLSFTGGPTLTHLERHYRAPRARALYCSVDAEAYTPQALPLRWDLGYMGTYSADRQPPLERLLLTPARADTALRMIVAGPLYPADIAWPANVARTEHLPPAEHPAFYNAQRYTLNITRADMVRLGYAPSVRLFEAAACATPIISDWWAGLDTLFTPGREILVARESGEVRDYLRRIADDERQRIGEAARRRVLAEHTAAHRAAQLADYAREALGEAAPTARSNNAFSAGAGGPT